jgi:hypothetical protein
MDKTRNKKRSRRKSRKITGGINSAVLKKDGKKLDKSEWTKITSLDKLNGYQVSYNDVTYEISDAGNKTMTWTGIKDEKGTLSKVVSGNLKRKKWLIGDAISQIYGVASDFFNTEIAKGDNESGDAIDTVKQIDSSTISEVVFTPTGVKFTYMSNTLPADINEPITTEKKTGSIKIAETQDPDWEKKVLNYYLQTINQTSIVGKLASTILPVGAVKRAAIKLATGKSMDAQLLEQKAKRVPILTEIQEVFKDISIPEGVYDAGSGELTFKAKLLTDGEGRYVVTDITVAK